jgi:hypothetical protein
MKTAILLFVVAAFAWAAWHRPEERDNLFSPSQRSTVMAENEGRRIEHIRALPGDSLIEIDAVKMMPDEAGQFAHDLRKIASLVRRTRRSIGMDHKKRTGQRLKGAH